VPPIKLKIIKFHPHSTVFSLQILTSPTVLRSLLSLIECPPGKIALSSVKLNYTDPNYTTIHTAPVGTLKHWSVYTTGIPECAIIQRNTTGEVETTSVLTLVDTCSQILKNSDTSVHTEKNWE